MATKNWQEIANKAAEELGVDKEEYRKYIIEYSKLLMRNIRDYSHIQYDFFGVGKLKWKVSNLRRVVKKAEEKGKGYAEKAGKLLPKVSEYNCKNFKHKSETKTDK